MAEIELRASRSSGPGGQHANVTASRVEAVFDVAASATLDEAQRARLTERAGPRSPPSPRTRAARRATASWRCSDWPRRSRPACGRPAAAARPGRPAPPGPVASSRSAAPASASKPAAAPPPKTDRADRRAGDRPPTYGVDHRHVADSGPMAKRKKQRRPREKAPDRRLHRHDGNALTLRQSLSRGTIAKVEAGPATAATTQDDAWHRRSRAPLRAPRRPLGDSRPPPDRPEDAPRPLPDGRPGNPAMGPRNDRRARRATHSRAGSLSLAWQPDGRGWVRTSDLSRVRRVPRFSLSAL